MDRRISIVVATMGGTAEMVAEALADRLGSMGWAVELLMMEQVSAQGLVGRSPCLVCTSTYGSGEVPDNGKALYAELRSGAVDLGGLRYGIVGLGDSHYPRTFGFGGKLFDEAFQACGAARIGERFVHDRRSSVYPEEAALDWLQDWLDALEQAVVLDPGE